MENVTKPEKLTYSVAEAATVLGIGLNKTYELIRQKKIPSLDLGRSIRVPKKQLHEMASGGE